MKHHQIPRLRMFAGPNGSCKSTIKNKLPNQLLGVYLNADDIEQKISQTGRFDLSVYQAKAQDALYYLTQSVRLTAFVSQMALLKVEQNALIFPFSINAYIASSLVDFLREHLLKNKVSFSFETVMSHGSKVEFLQQAQQFGFRTYLYFVATVSPKLISRVLNTA